MATSLSKNDLEKFTNIVKGTHKEQAIWFLNAMWEKGVQGSKAEDIWLNVLMYNDLDIKKKAQGCELDELNAHVFLEKNNQALTVKELRDKLREIGWEKRPMMFPILVFLIMKYKADWKIVVNASQGGNQEEIAKAQALLEEVQVALDSAIKAASDAAAREAEAQEAKAEMERAVAEVKAQEDARDNKTKDLQKKSEEGGAVSRNKAKAELAAHLSEDPLPLRKAKITLEAADRKAAKALKAATEAREKADAAVEAAQAKFEEAQAYLEEVKSKGGSGEGLIWWLERELTEKKKYMPTSKGGLKK